MRKRERGGERGRSAVHIERARKENIESRDCDKGKIHRERERERGSNYLPMLKIQPTSRFSVFRRSRECASSLSFAIVSARYFCSYCCGPPPCAHYAHDHLRLIASMSTYRRRVCCIVGKIKIRKRERESGE
jgi:hypothetical protein